MKKTFVIILIVVAALVLAAGGTLWYYVNKVQSHNDIPIVEKPAETPAPEAALVAMSTVDPASITPTPTPEPTPTAAPIYAVDQINEDVINVLLVGIDPREDTADAESTGNSDSMMLLSYNVKTNKAYLFSFMRDSYLYINNAPSWMDKMNKAYSNYGIGGLINTLNDERNYALDVQNYVAITFKMFEEIIDRFGGIEVELTTEECQFINKKQEKYAYDHHLPTFATVEVKDGPQVLSGELALWYARDRYSAGTSDFGRTSRQRHLISLLYKKIKEEWTVAKLMDTISYVANNAATNLSLDAMMQLVNIAMSNDVSIDGTTVPFPGTSHNGTNSKGKFALKFDIDETRETLLGVIYNGDSLPEGTETNFGGSNED